MRVYKAGTWQTGHAQKPKIDEQKEKKVKLVPSELY